MAEVFQFMENDTGGFFLEKLVEGWKVHSEKPGESTHNNPKILFGNLFFLFEAATNWIRKMNLSEH